TAPGRPVCAPGPLAFRSSADRPRLEMTTMSFPSWLRSWQSPTPHNPARPKRRRPGVKPWVEVLENRTLLTAGALDLSFGAGGKITTDFGGADNGRALAIQPDGKTVVVGYVSVGGVLDFGLARYNPDGSLDPTFGVGGRVTTDVGGNGDPDGVVI